MQRQGIIQTIDRTQMERAIKFFLVDQPKPVWVSPEYQNQVKALRAGDQVTFTVKAGNWCDFYQGHETRERPSAQNVSPDTGPLTESDEEQKPPYTPTRNKDLPPTPGKGRACSARFMAKFRDLVKAGKTSEEIASEYCFSVQEVYQLQAALETKEKIEQNVSQLTSEKRFDTDFDSIRPTHYVELSRVEDTKKQLELAKKVAKEQLPVSKLRKEIRGEVEPPKPEIPPRPEWIDTGPWVCPVCKENFRLLHLAEGRHKFEPVEVIEK